MHQNDFWKHFIPIEKCANKRSKIKRTHKTVSFQRAIITLRLYSCAHDDLWNDFININHIPMLIANYLHSLPSPLLTHSWHYYERCFVYIILILCAYIYGDKHKCTSYFRRYQKKNFMDAHTHTSFILVLFLFEPKNRSKRERRRKIFLKASN